jgi:hypothetical protein
VKSDPDVIALQEVRLDGGFVDSDGTTPHWAVPGVVNSLEQAPVHASATASVSPSTAAEVVKGDGGSQVEHVLSHLAQARRRLAVHTSEVGDAAHGETFEQYYQYVYQPAMSMIEL